MSEPKPDSVITWSPSLSPIRSATSDELPCAMLANGPACIRQGWPSSVWIRFGLSASFSSTAIAPAAPRSSAVTGLPPSKERATVIAAEARAQVLQVARHGEDGHHLGGRGDVEARLARVAVGAPALPERDPAQGAVVHVERALPVHPQGVDRVRVAVQDRGVEQRREQVVGRAHGVDVAGEVEVQVLHRHHLGQPAAGGAALDAEHRAERRLAQAEHRVLADLPEALGERHGGGGLALARLRRRHAGHAHELAVRRVAQAVEHAQRHLRLVAPVGLELVGQQPGALGDRVDRLKLRLLRDLETALHRHLSSHQWLTAAAASSDTSLSS